jgi:uncharacterized protein (TIGR03000 family)
MMPRRIILSLSVAALGGLLPLNHADGQFRDNNGYAIGIGFSCGSRGLFAPVDSGTFGVFPIYYNGYYGNGMSMYGPPVPTYGQVPTVWGGSDYRVNQNEPIVGVGTGWMYRSPTVRLPAEALNAVAEPGVLDQRVVDGALSPLTVEVRLPIENANVFINKQAIRGSGAVRLFASPPLKPGATYQYEVRAIWIINGQRTSLTRNVQGKAGETVVADFVK